MIDSPVDYTAQQEVLIEMTRWSEQNNRRSGREGAQTPSNAEGQSDKYPANYTICTGNYRQQRTKIYCPSQKVICRSQSLLSDPVPAIVLVGEETAELLWQHSHNLAEREQNHRGSYVDESTEKSGSFCVWGRNWLPIPSVFRM